VSVKFTALEFRDMCCIVRGELRADGVVHIEAMETCRRSQLGKRLRFYKWGQRRVESILKGSDGEFILTPKGSCQRRTE
jgi:hypothetical protein